MADQLKRLISSGAGPFLAAATQGIGLLQLLLLVRNDPSIESDAYFYLITWAQLPTQIILSGYVYPTWLSGLANVRRRLFIALIGAPVFAVLGVIGAGLVFSTLSKTYTLFAVHVFLFSILGLVLTYGWALSLRLSADGITSWASAVTLLANVLSCVALLTTIQLPQAERLTAMLVAQILGMSLTLIALNRRHSGMHRRLVSEPSRSRSSTSGVDWYLAQAVAGYGGLLVLQTASISLAPAALSILGLIGRFVSGLNMVITSAVVPRLIHAQSSSDEKAMLFLRVTCGLSLVLAIVVGTTSFASDLPYTAELSIVSAWFAAAVANSTFKRLAVRSLEPRAVLLPMLVNILTAVIIGALAITSNLSLSVLITAYIAMDLLPALVLSLMLRRAVTGAALTVTCLACAILIASRLS